MTRNIEELRTAIVRSRAGQTRWRCPSELKQEVVQFAEKRRDEGSPVQAIAKGLGVSESGLNRWLQPKPGRLKPVRVVEEMSDSGTELILVTPGGYRLEGLSTVSAAEVLRRLGC